MRFADQFGGFGPPDDARPHQHNSSATIRDLVSYYHARHSIRTGFESRFYQFNWDEAAGERGSLSFSNMWANELFGRPPDGVDNLSLRDFLIGAPIYFSITSGVHDRAFRAHDVVGFLQDDFRLTRRLTLNLGLRYDFLSNATEKRDRLGNFDPSRVPVDARQTGGAGLLEGFISPEGLKGFGTKGVSPSMLLGEDRYNFSPRLGFAYDVGGKGKLAVRGGYGIFFNRLSALGPFQLAFQPPFRLLIMQSGFFGAGILQNPFPVLPFPSGFPILPKPPTLIGFSDDGRPVFNAPLLNIQAIDRELRTPYMKQWNFTIQHEFRPKWILELGYLGSHGNKLLNTRGINNALLRNGANPGP
jgi:hypothetical protein